MRKILFLNLISFALVFQIAFAEDKAFIVNPTNIKNQIMSKNMTLLQALNNVENSKLNVTMARAKLLPTLNLTVLLPALANPTFLLGSINYLFPFLVPSNWATLRQQKELFEADKASYKALQLNVYSNSLSLYYTYLSDFKVQDVYSNQATALERLYLLLKKQSDVLGNVPQEDLESSKAEFEESKIKVSKLEELLGEERASLRTMLGLPLGTTLNVESVPLPPSTLEDKSAQEISDISLKSAPEMLQLDFLVKAAKANKFAKQFGFISSGSISGSTSSSSPNVFDNLKAGGSFVFGVDNLVNIKIAENNLDSLNLRYDQLREENERVSEVITEKLVAVKNQKMLSASSMQSRLNVYEIQKKQYALGLISLQTLLQTEAQLTDSKVNSLKIDFDLDMQRLTLKRLVIEQEFQALKGCVESSDKNESHGLFGIKIKKDKDKEQSLDQICQN